MSKETLCQNMVVMKRWQLNLSGFHVCVNPFSIPVFKMMPNLINPIVAYQRVLCDHILNLTYKQDFSSVNSIDLEIMFRILNLVNSRCDSEVSTSNNTNNMINFLFLYIRYLLVFQ
uniref:Uncharacterized protein n=1 Tax=Cacopsylla melanoneura TaxID=428564 RepID=A0A8D9FHY7_9HEMI